MDSTTSILLFISLAVILMAALPVVIAYSLRKMGIVNGIISLASFVLMICLVIYSFSLFGYDAYIFVGHLIWMVPASWALIFGLFAMNGKGRILAIISLSLAMAFFLAMMWLA